MQLELISTSHASVHSSTALQCCRGPIQPPSPLSGMHPTSRGWEHSLAPRTHPEPHPAGGHCRGSGSSLSWAPHELPHPSTSHRRYQPPNTVFLGRAQPQPSDSTMAFPAAPCPGTPGGAGVPTLQELTDPSPGPRGPMLAPAAGLVGPGLQQQRLEPADGDGGEDEAQEDDAEQDPGRHAQQALLCHPVVTAQPHEPEIAAHGAPAPRGSISARGVAPATPGCPQGTHWQRGCWSRAWVQMPWFLQ